MSPKVSIIIPCYNSEKWVSQCILSAINQSYENIEVIAVDNESTDGTLDVLKDIQSKKPSLRILTAPNIYPNCWDEARSEAYKHLTGDYFTVIGSDDYLSENYIENCLKYVLAAPEKILVFQSPMMGVRSDTHISTGEVMHSYRSIKQFKEMSLTQCPVNSPTVLYNRKLLKDGALQTKPEKFGGAADYNLYCQLAEDNILIYPAPRWLGFYYRWHEEQATWKVQSEGKNYDKLIQDYWRQKWNL
jgi:glycosyltransferase involved in cell wall biosynthesis